MADLRSTTLFSFSSHTAVITGGASGLGAMAARAFVQNGARVIIASRKEAELRKTSDELNQLGPGRCDWVVADLKDKKGCKKLAEEVGKLVGEGGVRCLISECFFLDLRSVWEE